ncbi:MAG: hypothetical protein AABY80_03935 [Candidatus Deferrimicrobiota bacterium]
MILVANTRRKVVALLLSVTFLAMAVPGATADACCGHSPQASLRLPPGVLPALEKDGADRGENPPSPETDCCICCPVEFGAAFVSMPRPPDVSQWSIASAGTTPDSGHRSEIFRPPLV